jgi:hypothetical protein
VVCNLPFILCFHCHSVVLWPIGPLSGPFIVTVGYHASVCVNNFYGGYQSHQRIALLPTYLFVIVALGLWYILVLRYLVAEGHGSLQFS